MSQISLKQLEAFVQVARQGSFRRAAAVLNTTQPNISARISSLEGQLGQKLMHRDAGSVTLTPVGETLLQKSRSVITAVDSLLVSAQNPNLFEGSLRLGVTETIAHSWLGIFLNRFSSQFPQVIMDLVVDLSASLTKGLEDHSIDLAFQSGPFDKSVWSRTDLGDYPMQWVASPELKIRNKPLSIADMSGYSILSHAKNTLPFEQMAEHFSASDNPVRLVPSTSQSACLRMTMQGIGVSCLPEVILRDEISRDTLVPIPYAWMPDALHFEARFNDASAPHYLKQAARIAADVSFESLACQPFGRIP